MKRHSIALALVLLFSATLAVAQTPRQGFPEENLRETVEELNRVAIRQARAQMDEARNRLERAQQLAEKGLLAKSELDAISSAYKVTEAQYAATQQGGGRGAAQPPGGQRGSNAASVVPQATGLWWTVPAIVQRLGLSDDQRKKIERIFDQYRDSMFDRTADLEREEAVLKPMLAAETPDSAKILSQVDRVVHARGEMEKTYARMTLEMRQCLTRSQWIQLQELQSPGFAGPGTRGEAQR